MIAPSCTFLILIEIFFDTWPTYKWLRTVAHPPGTYVNKPICVGHYCSNLGTFSNPILFNLSKLFSKIDLNTYLVYFTLF